ncbi:MAG: hypothetical protein LBU89_08095 [Fibromonadaceae bacterium]|jgi:hypothetical protein|nr:hypothetical protein [Fibromonadaceae bacterium]
MLIRFLKKCLNNPWHILIALGARSFFSWMSDSLFLKMIFKAHLGYSLDLKNPKTFNEKIQWLKLYGNLEKYANLVDKYEVRKYIAETIGEEYLIPLLGVWDRFEDIDFGKLPEQFVLKCTHDSGSVVICKNKAAFDVKAAQSKLNKHLEQNFYHLLREPQYKNIKPRIIAEKYMVDESGTELKDYKIFCFDGQPKIIQVDFDRFTNHKRNLYDVEWNFLNFEIHYPSDKIKQISKPQKFDEMLDLAKKLSAAIPHVRVDFYSICGKIYFGELTFTHGSGYENFEPEEFGFEMGSWIELSKEAK